MATKKEEPVQTTLGSDQPKAETRPADPETKAAKAETPAAAPVTTAAPIEAPAVLDTTNALPIEQLRADVERSIAVFADEANFVSGIRMAKALAASSLVPEVYRNNVANVMIALELSHRIGASVFAVMQNMDLIHQRPSWRATFLIATVNASGRFSPLRFRFQGTEGKADWGCRAVARDRETGEECIGTLITIGMATAEGWATKSGSKWKTMPEQMLMYRAAAFWTRIYAPELSLGMHTVEEVQDVFDAPPSVPQTKRLAQAISGVGNALQKGEAIPAIIPAVDHDPDTGEIVPTAEELAARANQAGP